MTHAGVRYEASLYVNEQTNNMWAPVFQTNGILSPASAAHNKLRLSMTFGDANVPGEVAAYIFTFVNRLGEESAPVYIGEIWVPNNTLIPELVIESAAAAAKIAEISTDRYPIHGLRLYRTAISGASAMSGGYYYVGCYKFGTGGADLPGETYLNTTAYTETGREIVPDYILGTALGSACDTIDLIHDVSELQKLQGLTTLYNGMLAAYKGNEVWYCEPYKPWAWKRANVHTLPHKVVKLLPQEQGVYILTEQYPFYASGATPESMVPTRIPAQYPCVSSEAATVVNGKALYLSPDGVVLLNGGNAEIENFVWSRETWRESLINFSATAKPRLVAYGHRALIYFQNSPSWGGLVYDTADNAWSYFTGKIDYAFPVPPGAWGNYADELACSVPGTATWMLFGATANATRNFVWWSKDFIKHKPMSYGAVQIFGSGTVQLAVYADDALKHTVSITLATSGVVVRLPSGFLAAKWSFKLTAQSSLTEVTEFNVAVSPREFQGV
jgi:hypothetical protein